MQDVEVSEDAAGLGSRRRRTRLSQRVRRSSVSARATVSWNRLVPRRAWTPATGATAHRSGNVVTPSSLSISRNTCQALRSSGVRRRSTNSRRGTPVPAATE